jgi:hypothetical protein
MTFIAASSEPSTREPMMGTAFAIGTRSSSVSTKASKVSSRPMFFFGGIVATISVRDCGGLVGRGAELEAVNIAPRGLGTSSAQLHHASCALSKRKESKRFDDADCGRCSFVLHATRYSPLVRSTWLCNSGNPAQPALAALSIARMRQRSLSYPRPRRAARSPSRARASACPSSNTVRRPSTQAGNHFTEQPVQEKGSFMPSRNTAWSLSSARPGAERRRVSSRCQVPSLSRLNASQSFRSISWRRAGRRTDV